MIWKMNGWDFSWSWARRSKHMHGKIRTTKKYADGRQKKCKGKKR